MKLAQRSSTHCETFEAVRTLSRPQSPLMVNVHGLNPMPGNGVSEAYMKHQSSHYCSSLTRGESKRYARTG